MVIAAIELISLLKGIPPGSWVALSGEGGSVLAFGPDADKVFEQAQARGEQVPLITRVPERELAMFF